MADRTGKVEAMTDYIFLDFKIIADGDYSHEIKRHLPWKESYDKSRQHIKNLETLVCQQKSV